MNNKLISAAALAALLGTGLGMAGEANAFQIVSDRGHHHADRDRASRHQHAYDKRRDHVEKQVHVEKRIYRERHDRGRHYGHHKGDRFERYYRHHKGRDYYRPHHRHHTRWGKRDHHQHHHIERAPRRIERTEHYRYDDDDRPGIRFRIDYHGFM